MSLGLTELRWVVCCFAGSFGKVYKGYWGGREVAIKVIA
jgi:predicted Ser/Thr protein kinase